uniref:NADH dehydrogenase subunit 6 n=1 Tax=Neohylomys hainanensis TaxID=483536 RepID=UPI00202867E9|nr:NADH dehydrogenase subunit 6 [Neohylomys hainanensis]
MTAFITLVLSGLFVVGFAIFSSKPSPIYGGVGLVISGGVGCGIVLNYGGSFLGMLVFLIYLGGMLVVFGYTTDMAMDEFPEMWLSNKVVLVGLFVVLVIELLLMLVMENSVEKMELVVSFNGEGDWVIYDTGDTGFFSEEVGGVAALYSYGYWLMIVSGWSLVFCVVVIMEITRGN